MSNILIIDDIPSDDNSYKDKNFPDNYENYIYINLYILYNLLNKETQKNKQLKDFKELTNKKLYDNLCKIQQEDANISEPDKKDKIDKIYKLLDYIDKKNNIADKCNRTSNLPVPPTTEVAQTEEVSFTVASNVKFNLNKNENDSYYVSNINDSTLTKLKAYKKDDIFYLSLKSNLYVKQYKNQQDTKLIFINGDINSNSEITIYIENNNILFLPTETNKNNDNDILFLILLYIACLEDKDSYYNSYNKQILKDILNVTSHNDLYIYWKKIFSYFDKDLEIKIDKFIKVCDTKNKFKFTIDSNKKIETDDNLKVLNIDSLPQNCDDIELKVEKNETKCEYFLRFNPNIDKNIDVYEVKDNDEDILKFNYNSDTYTCKIEKTSVIIKRDNTDMNNQTLFDNNLNLEFLILLYVVMNNNYKPELLKNVYNFLKISNITGENEIIYCYWKQVFNFFDKNLDDFLTILNKSDEYKFIISDKLIFKLDTNNILKLKGNTCSDGDDSYQLLLHEGDPHKESLKIPLSKDNFYLVDKIGESNFLNNFTFNFIEFFNNDPSYYNKKEVEITDNSITLKGVDISEKNNCNELYMILLFLYLNHKDNINNYYKQFHYIVEECKTEKDKWKNIFCKFGISNNDFDTLINEINKINIPPPPPQQQDFTFSIAPNLIFIKDVYHYQLKTNSCQDITSNLLAIIDNNMKLEIHDIELIIYSDIEYHNSISPIFHINYYNTEYKFIINNNDIYLFEYGTIPVAINKPLKDIINNNHFYYLILLYIYLNKSDNNDILNKYISLFYDLDYSIHYIWKNIFCNFGILNQDFNNLIIFIFKNKIKNFFKTHEDIIELEDRIYDKESIGCGIENEYIRNKNYMRISICIFTFYNETIFINMQQEIINIDISIDLLYIRAVDENYKRIPNTQFYINCNNASDNDKIYTITTIAFNSYIKNKHQKLRLLDVSLTYANHNAEYNNKLRKQLYYGIYDSEYGFYYKKDKSRSVIAKLTDIKDFFIGYTTANNDYVLPNTDGNEYIYSEDSYVLKAINGNNTIKIEIKGTKLYKFYRNYFQSNGALIEDPIGINIDVINDEPVKNQDELFTGTDINNVIYNDLVKWDDTSYIIKSVKEESDKIRNRPVVQNVAPSYEVVYSQPQQSLGYSSPPQQFEYSSPQVVYLPPQQSYPVAFSPSFPVVQHQYSPSQHHWGGDDTNKNLYIYILIVFFNKLIKDTEKFKKLFN